MKNFVMELVAYFNQTKTTPMDFPSLPGFAELLTICYIIENKFAVKESLNFSCMMLCMWREPFIVSTYQA